MAIFVFPVCFIAMMEPVWFYTHNGTPDATYAFQPPKRTSPPLHLFSMMGKRGGLFYVVVVSICVCFV